MSSLIDYTYPFTQPEAQRLDHFLTEKLPEFSRSRLQQIIKNAGVFVNGREITKTGTMLENGDEVRIEIPEIKVNTLQPESIPLTILYEDENVLVLDKAAGMVVHPSAGHQTGTLVHAVLSHVPQAINVGGVERPGVVHRLDKDTSGIILMAKNDTSHQWLQKQFKDRLVEKSYLTLVTGHPPTPVGRIEAPIGRDPKDRLRMAVLSDDRGKHAITSYTTLKRYRDNSLLQVDIFTGRTHQIRVHMKFIGCPVVGDVLYGIKRPALRIERQFLHAASLSICLPGQKTKMHFESPLPADLQAVLDKLEKEQSNNAN
jgi:23S rRNA pseudouridine1911/1915/1917 synthase